MNRTFVNFSNHPSGLWQEEQKNKALEYGEILDVPFPEVDAMADEEEVLKLAEESVEEILRYNPAVVLCQGEFCLAYQVISLLKEKGIIVLAACSERNTTEIQENGETRKESVFRFRQFRKYQ